MLFQQVRLIDVEVIVVVCPPLSVSSASRSVFLCFFFRCFCRFRVYQGSDLQVEKGERWRVFYMYVFTFLPSLCAPPCLPVCSRFICMCVHLYFACLYLPVSSPKRLFPTSLTHLHLVSAYVLLCLGSITSLFILPSIHVFCCR